MHAPNPFGGRRTGFCFGGAHGYHQAAAGFHDRDTPLRPRCRHRARRVAQAVARLGRLRLSRCARSRRRVPGPRAGLCLRSAGQSDHRRARSQGDEDGGRRGHRLLRDRHGGDRRDDARAPAQGRPRRGQPVPVRQHGEPVQHARLARDGHHVRRRDGRRQRGACADARRRGSSSSRRSPTRARRSPISRGSALSPRSAEFSTSSTTR